MGAAKASEKAKGARLTTVNVSTETANRLRVIAVQRGVTIPEALEQCCRPAIDRAYRKVLADAAEGGE